MSVPHHVSDAITDKNIRNMTNSVASQNNSDSNNSESSNNGKVKRKRNRPTIVCMNCKHRRCKCDRGKPCGTCVKFGDQDTCVYVENTEQQTSQSLQSSREPGKRKRRKYVKKSYAIKNSSPEFINIMPNGIYVETKRSAVNVFPYFTDIAMEHRDSYLSMMIRFRSIAIRSMMKKCEQSLKAQHKKSGLPNSFLPLSVFDSHEQETINERYKENYKQHKFLFEKYAKQRKDNSMKINMDEFQVMDYLIGRDVLFNEVLPFFTKNILSIIPIFDMNILKKEFEIFYDTVKRDRKVSIKKYDHIILSIILLIISLTQLSVKATRDNRTEVLYEEILKIDTSKYIAIVNFFLFQTKTLRKCTLLQLQCLLLLKLYHWSGPEDGDGSDGQHNQILLGTIISSAKEMGINWNSVIGQPYIFKISDCTRPSIQFMDQKDYETIYKKIWALILYWDRKTFFSTGQECVIGKSFSIRFNNIDFPNTWHLKIIEIDNLILKINDLIHDSPTRINITTINDLVIQLKQEVVMIRNVHKIAETHLDFEFDWMVDMLDLSLLHAKMIHYENDLNYIKFHESMQELWNFLIRIAKNCYDYFYSTASSLNVFTKFYCNRIVEIVTNKVCVLVPTFILRASRFPKLDYSDRQLMCKFLFGISSIYFNEFGYDHYRTFKKMFSAKISYKILDRPRDKDAWQIILHFLNYELKYHSDFNDPDRRNDSKLMNILPYLETFYNRVRDKSIDVKDRDKILEVWNEEMFPISQYDQEFKLNIQEEALGPFLVDRYENILNIFDSFYCKYSAELATCTEQVGKADDGTVPGNTENTGSVNVPIYSSGVSEPSVVPMDNLFYSDTSSELSSKLSPPEQRIRSIVIDRNGGSTDTGVPVDESVLTSNSFSNLEILDEIFEPLDFISFFN